MLKFFRKIRRNLLSEGKSGTYFKYALGEVFLVVIGILIALQINNWNENRKQLKQQYFLFQQLLSDAKADSVFFTNRLEGLAILDSTLISIRKLEDNPNYDILSINTNGTGNVLPMNSFRYESNLLNNNEDVYKELSNFEIKSMFREYRAKYSYVNNSYNVLNDMLVSVDLSKSKLYYKELRDNKTNRSRDALMVIYKDKDLQSLVDRLMVRTSISKRRTKDLLETNAELIKKLTEIIGNR